jgi:outer membrane protein TolC
MNRRVVVWAVAAGLTVSGTVAQGFGGGGGSAPAAQAAPVPLSGRNPQAGSVNAGQAAAPGAGVNTLSPSVQASGAFTGSTPGAQPAFSGQLTLADAIQRGLDYNLGTAQWANTVRQAEGQSRSARAALLPHLNASLTEQVQQLSLHAAGFNFKLPSSAGFSIPAVVGPFSYMDLQAALSESVLDFTALRNYHATQQTLRANQLEQQDARNLVVLGVGGAYLGVVAAQARLSSAEAQLATAQAILQQSQEKKSVGAVPQLTVNQNQVQASIQQLQLATLRNDVAKRKIDLARMIGLPPTADYQLTDAVPFAAPPALGESQAVAAALSQRLDLQAAQAQTAAARDALAAAHGERLPSASISGSYGVLGTTFASNAHGVFSLAGTISLPLWNGGRVSGDIQQADAALAQRQSEAADLRAQIEAQVREAYLDLGTASTEVEVAQNNLNVAQQALQMTRDRFQAGVINTVELIQAQQQVSAADQDYINSVYAHNLAKLTLARDLGNAPTSWTQYLKAVPAH